MSLSQNNCRADNNRAGRCSAPNAPFSSSQPGILDSHLLVVRWGAGSKQGYPAPALAVANNICASQTILSATTALINGALASGGVATPDVPRNVQLVSSNAGDTTQVATIRGLDTIGRASTETVSMNGTTIVQSLRAYSKINSITFSAALAGNLTAGTGAKLGLPVRIRVGDVLVLKANDAVPEAGTIVAGVTTTPTAATGDPLGTLVTTTAMNGTVIFTALLNVEDHTENAYGSQFSS